MRRVGILAMAKEGHGGTLLYTLSMIEALKLLPADEYSLVLYTAHDNYEYDHLGIRVERLPSKLAIMGRIMTGQRLFKGVDALMAPIYSTLLLATSRPFAFTLHDMQERHLPQNFSRATRLWRHITNRLLTSRACRVVCESQFVQADIVRFLHAPLDKVIVIPAPPVSPLLDNPPDSRAVEMVRQRHALPKHYLFYPAQFWPHKNHRRLLDAFALLKDRFPDQHLVFTGKRRDEFDNVCNHARELGLESRFHHVGYVDQSDLACLYRGATLAVVPTLFESISIPIYEAFALGVPVCASNVVGLPEQVGDAALLFDPRSITDIAEKVALALSDDALRQTLVSRGKTRMSKITHSNYANKLASVVAACVAASTDRSSSAA